MHEAAQLLGDPGEGAKQLRELQQQIDIIQETLFRGSYALLCGLRPPYSLPHPALHSYKMCSPMRSCSFGSSGGRQSMRRIKFGMWPPPSTRRAVPSTASLAAPLTAPHLVRTTTPSGGAAPHGHFHKSRSCKLQSTRSYRSPVAEKGSRPKAPGSCASQRSLLRATAKIRESLYRKNGSSAAPWRTTAT